MQDLDFDHCETLDKSFVADHYKATESDIIYKVRLKGREVYLIILLEFQVTVDRFMVLRVLNYLTNFYMDYVQSTPKVTMLPPVFPIVLYNGDDRWTAPVQLTDIIEAPHLLGDYVPRFAYCKIVEHEYPKEALLRIRNIVSTLFLAESYYEFELIKRELLALFQHEPDRQAVSLLLNWFRQLAAHQRIDPAEYAEFEQVYHTVEEVKTMLVTALECERHQLREEGRQEGRQEGILEGILEGIKLSLEVKFGDQGLALFQEIATLLELDALRAVSEVIRREDDPEQVRAVILAHQ